MQATSLYNVYDLGAAHNLAQIFGGRDRWREWLWPVGWPPGDGQEFPIDRSKLEKLQEVTAEIRLIRPPREGEGEGEGLSTAAAQGVVRARA